ncbi:L-2-amino-thiazoline-4-carboxylic acid hydrolase [Siminovitchia sediminis]|uniref:L-2-amino-thiazoline-4-carboxylic acid hydrolase n=1 Tax=Siminovitchia sediminis TaxID=1274353 RepID=A0ABW4KM87_9BACI
MKTINDVPLLLRREIEARMIKPFLEAFTKEVGKERTYEIAECVIEELARKAGEESAQRLGDNGTKELLEHIKPHQMVDALDINPISQDEKHNRFDIVRCEYVEMYERLGMREMGGMLSCNRDECFFRGVNPKFKFSRTKTLMNGDDCCNFLVELEDSAK